MNLETWYGSSVLVPGYHSRGFTPFVASSIGLVRTVLARKMDKTIAVLFKNIQTAAADTENNRIYVSEEFLKGRFPGRERLPARDTISAILGLIVHEAGHFLYDPKGLAPYAEYIAAKTTCHFDKEVALTLSNIIADIFLEHQINENIPSFSWMLESVNNLMFNVQTLQKVEDRAKEVVGSPQNQQELTALLDVLIQAKVYDEIMATEFVTGLFEKAKSTKVMVEESSRHQVALEIYDTLMVNMEAEDMDKRGLEKFLKDMLGVTADHTKRQSIGKATNRETDKLNKTLDKLENTTVIPTTDESGEETMVFETYLTASGTQLEVDQKYLALAQLARQRTAVNKPYGLDMHRGSNIRRLWRIATDQKIFAQRVEMKSFKPMQVVILVDFSGSMQGGLPNSTKSCLQVACEAAMGAAYGLTEGGCEVEVVGHSGDLVMAGDVHLYRLKDFNEPVSIIPQRADVDDSELTRENRDGVAIREVAKHFRGSRKKLLIVFSDGCPMANAYYGPSANDHTKSEVDKVRAAGIQVLSISINEGASHTNNYIYGKENNIFNEDPNVIAEIVNALLLE